VVSLAAKLLIEQFSIDGEAYCVARQKIILKNFCQISIASLIVLYPAIENRDANSQRKEKKTEIQKLLVCQSSEL